MQFTDVNSGSRPSPLPPIPFFKSTPAKNQNGEERQGERAGRAVLRAWRGSALALNRSVRCSSKPPRLMGSVKLMELMGSGVNGVSHAP
ncbi:MAG TPA: hypothetical protein VI957_01615 [Candidatus Paceibacterota bacterium]